MTLLPTLVLNGERRDKPLGAQDYVGWGMWGLGFIIEAVADQQKWNFRNNPDNKVGVLLSWDGRGLSRAVHIILLNNKPLLVAGNVLSGPDQCCVTIGRSLVPLLTLLYSSSCPL